MGNGNLTNGNPVNQNQNYNRPNGILNTPTNSNNFTRTNSYTNLQSVLPNTIKFENNNNFASNGFTNLTNTLTNTLMTPTQSFTENISLPIASSSPITTTQHNNSCDFSIRVTQSQIPLSQSPQ